MKYNNDTNTRSKIDAPSRPVFCGRLCKTLRLNALPINLFSIAESQTKSFECGASLRGIKLIFAIIYISFLKNSYLWIKESTNNAPPDRPSRYSTT